MNLSVTTLTHGLICLLLLSLTACAPATPERKRFFWPAAVAEPKVEYINFFQSNLDVKRGTENWLAEAIFGKERPSPVFERPLDVASDGRGRIFVTDITHKVVFVFDLTRHQLRTLQAAKGGAQVLGLPVSVEVDAAGQAWVVDSQNDKVYLFGPDEKLRRVFDVGSLARPVGLAVDSRRQRLYVADVEGHQLGVFDLDGNLLQIVGRRGKAEGEFNFPVDVDLDDAGNLYVLDSMNARVQVFDPDGRFLRSFGERGTAAGSFQIPKGIAVSPSGHVYVTDSMAHRFVIFDLRGTYLLSVGGKADATEKGIVPGGFYLPAGIDVDANDTIWVVDSLNRIFHQFQYLNEAYRREHPILPGQGYRPPGWQPDAAGEGGDR